MKRYKLVYYSAPDELFIFDKATGIAYNIINEQKKRELIGRDDLVRYDGRPLEHAELTITEKCNFKCLHCFVSAPGNLVLSLDKLKEVLSELRDMGVLHVTISGGEPFTQRHIFEILDMIVANDMVISAIDTNGTLISKDRARKLSEYPIIKGVKISLHGATARTHAELTQGSLGSFRMVFAALQNLKEYGVKTLINTIIHSKVVQDFPALFAIIQEYDIREWSLRTIIPSGRGYGNYEKLVPEPGLLIPALRELSEKYKSERPNFLLYGDLIDVFLQGRYNPSALLSGDSPCEYLNRALFIGAGGGVMRCGISPSVGNISNQGIKDIWESEEMRIQKGPPTNPNCLECHYLRVGLCKAYKYVCPAAGCNDYVKSLLNELEQNLVANG